MQNMHTAKASIETQRGFSTRAPSVARASCVASVVRALGLLEQLALASSPLSLGEISRELQLPPSTTHRLLATLSGAGFVSQELHTDRYMATLKLFNLGSMVLSQFNLSEMLLPTMRRIADQVGESVSLVVLEGNEGVLLERVAGSRGLQVFSKYRRVPLYCTAAGKALLAGFDDKSLENYLSRTPLKRLTQSTICTSSALRTEMERIHAVGYAVDREEVEKGARCVAVPLVFARGTPAAVSVSALAPRMTENRIKEIATYLKKVLRDPDRALALT